ncbi:TetR/AcrR family transcriptional regulator [Geodermatophilus sp. DSM 45219]|uniref:TetR/AcrR family transcriptional regulator n=1 Tax=Geodermatophilus sp. DSM 45219 TaxID=1881103 RepID=UPI00088C8EED|nr:TetR/AcrR family transcriptional regulator [Geodermatophilus sp. DSM 45219]SDO23160.1 transcriptional regulator, TetR family [Geodermatophilus sp. DSM 45219]
MAGTGVREVARRAVHAEITSAAEFLFREQGYDATTVDQIAERVGMSQRTFFRHVGTKEDLVLAEFDRQSERMVADLQSRPAGEDPWTSLRHAFEVVVGQREDPTVRERAKLMMSIVETSGTLRAAYFDRMDLVQRQLVDVLLGRAHNTESRVIMRALVGAAFAALHAVSENCDLDDGPDTFAADLDQVLARLAPAVV